MLPLINLFTGGDEIFLEKDHVDVYDLILEKGMSGALKYANQVEDTQPQLANEIDRAVFSMCKNAGMVKVAQDLPLVPYNYTRPSFVPPSFTPPSYTPPASKARSFDPSDYSNGHYRPKGVAGDIDQNLCSISFLPANTNLYHIIFPGFH